MRIVWLLFVGLAIAGTACTANGGDDTSSTVPVSTDGYISEAVPGSDVRYLFQTNGGGVIQEEGFLDDSLRTGAWVSYYPNSNFPKSLTHFVDGRANGVYYEFNERGQMTLQAHYKDNKLDGYYAKYRFGRPTMEAGYVKGELDGAVREYHVSTGDLQKEITYKMGVMDGPYRFYNEKGEVTIEYLYQNGKKVSGGALNSDGSNEPM